MNTLIRMKPCSTGSDFSSAMQIMDDYMAWLNMDLSFQEIEKELSSFPSMYGPPGGIFLLAWYGKALAGVAGLRRYTDDICEMKRLFVYDRFRRNGSSSSIPSADSS